MAVQPHFSVYELMKHHISGVGRTPEMVVALDGFILYLCRCYSYIGRRYNAQELSLQKSGCVYHDTVQHEVLHALGFNHEQTRSDRDQHIRVVWENITPGLSVFTFHYPWQQYK